MEFLIAVWIGVALLVGVAYLSNAKTTKRNARLLASLVEKNPDFAEAKRIDLNFDNTVLITERGYLALRTGGDTEFRVFHVNDLNGFEVIIDGTTPANFGGAVAGGLIFGGVGAIVGGLSSQRQKISDYRLVFKLNDFKNPSKTVSCLVTGQTIKKGSIFWKEVEAKVLEIASTLEVVERNCKTKG